jgi:aerobic-type carbon monoxide dehydrogenase small subunit (CoxS/CutS family)
VPKRILTLRVNGEEHTLAVATNDTLLDVLREQLELTGVKEGCGEGACGSCTVLMDGVPRRACLTLALEAQESEIVTVEGLVCEGEMSPLQKSFVENHAIQCGFCTPGMLIAGTHLLSRNPQPSEAEVRKALAGHVCRCTGYAKIVRAVVGAGQEE